MRNWKDKISEHISYTEATKSHTAEKHGISNEPNKEQLENMKHLAENIFEPTRNHYGVPIGASSFFRSEELNTKIGGVKVSQHCKGQAIDMDADIFGMISNKDIFEYIKNNLEFDQLIWEFGDDKEPSWVHVSLKKKGKNRNRILKAYKEKNWKGNLITKYKEI